mmetsp:Transcript_12169/g.14476  ORF Transcript_12169/g.14476 Transcript_12169/m.14476 type:complete len:309 (+) Transcript_12169:1971-2897(+)
MLATFLEEETHVRAVWLQLAMFDQMRSVHQQLNAVVSRGHVLDINHLPVAVEHTCGAHVLPGVSDAELHSLVQVCLVSAGTTEEVYAVLVLHRGVLIPSRRGHSIQSSDWADHGWGHRAHGLRDGRGFCHRDSHGSSHVNQYVVLSGHRIEDEEEVRSGDYSKLHVGEGGLSDRHPRCGGSRDGGWALHGQLDGALVPELSSQVTECIECGDGEHGLDTSLSVVETGAFRKGGERGDGCRHDSEWGGGQQSGSVQAQGECGSTDDIRGVLKHVLVVEGMAVVLGERGSGELHSLGRRPDHLKVGALGG